MCVHYMDRVLERLMGVQLNQLQLLAAACLSLAAKSRAEAATSSGLMDPGPWTTSEDEEEDEETRVRPVLSLQTLVLYADNSFTLAELKVQYQNSFGGFGCLMTLMQSSVWHKVSSNRGKWSKISSPRAKQ